MPYVTTSKSGHTMANAQGHTMLMEQINNNYSTLITNAVRCNLHVHYCWCLLKIVKHECGDDWITACGSGTQSRMGTIDR
eukprot:COSAG02_NODE_4306_length_5528_cov_12.059495_2_plen_80_part_00